MFAAYEWSLKFGVAEWRNETELVRCPENAAVTRFRGVDGNSFVCGTSMACNVDPIDRLNQIVGYPPDEDFLAYTQKCPPGQAASGIRGHQFQYNYFLSLGLICRPIEFEPVMDNIFLRLPYNASVNEEVVLLKEVLAFKMNPILREQDIDISVSTDSELLFFAVDGQPVSGFRAVDISEGRVSLVAQRLNELERNVNVTFTMSLEFATRSFGHYRLVERNVIVYVNGTSGSGNNRGGSSPLMTALVITGGGVGLGLVVVATIIQRRRSRAGRGSVDLPRRSRSTSFTSSIRQGPPSRLTTGASMRLSTSHIGNTLMVDAGSSKDNTQSVATMTYRAGAGAGAQIAVPGYLKLNSDDVALEEIIGSGGSCIVQAGRLLGPVLLSRHARSLGSEGEVAVKFAKPEQRDAALQDAIAELRWEAAILGLFASAGHPNVVSFVGYLEEPAYGLVLKRYRMTLRDCLLDTEMFPELAVSQLVKWAREIALGMAEIHRYQVVHLDLKPLNVLMEWISDDQTSNNADGSSNPGSKLRCVISDFGGANVIGTGTFNASRIIRGLEQPAFATLTVVYASPELFERLKTLRQASNEVDKKMDVYSFAITLLEMLTRQTAWEGFDAQGVISRVQAGSRPDIPARVSSQLLGTPQEYLLRLIQACWRQSPTDRPGFVDIATALARQSFRG